MRGGHYLREPNFEVVLWGWNGGSPASCGLQVGHLPSLGLFLLCVFTVCLVEWSSLPPPVSVRPCCLCRTFPGLQEEFLMISGGSYLGTTGSLIVANLKVTWRRQSHQFWRRRAEPSAHREYPQRVVILFRKWLSATGCSCIDRRAPSSWWLGNDSLTAGDVQPMHLCMCCGGRL